MGNYTKVCGEQETFSEACFEGEVPEEDPSKPDEKPPIKLEIDGDKQPSQYSPSVDTAINGKPVKLKLDLGGNVWIVGTIDGQTLTMVKTRFTGGREATFMEKRRKNNFDEACGKQDTFTAACFQGKVPEEDPSKPDEKPPIRLDIVANKEPSQYSPSESTAINGKPVTLKLDLGGNIWIVGAIDGETLTMVKTRFTGGKDASFTEKRKEKNYDQACSKQDTFTEACFKGDVPEEDLSTPN